MDKSSDPKSVHNIIENIHYPVVLKNMCKWPLLEWTLDDWTRHLNTKDLPFRCKSNKTTDEPCWERNCSTKTLSFEKFVEEAQSKTDDWLYFDYKYMHQWLKDDSELFKQINWEAFGYPEIGGTDSTIWVGSNGAHTPCHQDTYGKNIVVQVFGRKRWLLFPPECGGMLATRIPYEESSIYSKLNFAKPENLKAFNGLPECKMVVLEPGDALVVPNRWWHYVEHISPIGITINSWIPCEELDAETRVEEALTRLIVGLVCKELPESRLPFILNPNEDDLPDVPFAVTVLQIEKTAAKYLEYQNKKNSSKRRKLSASAVESAPPETVKKSVNLDKLIEENADMQPVKSITRDQLMEILKQNKERLNSESRTSSVDDEDYDEEDGKNEQITSAIINSFCESSVIQKVKENLLNRLSSE